MTGREPLTRCLTCGHTRYLGAGRCWACDIYAQAIYQKWIRL